MANASFAYKVRDRNGRELTGEIEGDSRQNVTAKLRQAGYFIIDVNQKTEATTVEDIFQRFKKVKPKELTIFSRQFSTMVNSGLSLLRCLFILEEQTENKKLQKIITSVRQDIEAGQPLSESLEKFPNVFSHLYVSMIKAGEIGGILDITLNRIASFMEKEDELRGKVKSAMTYPVMILIMVILVVGGMIMFVLPKFGEMYKSMGAELPGLTQSLMGLSSLLTGFWWIIFPGIYGSYYGFRKYTKSEVGKPVWDKTKLKIPIVGNLIHKISVARFTRTFGTLLKSGVPILQAIEITGQTSGNYVIEMAMNKIQNSVREGESIGKPLEASGVFPPMVNQMVSVGEETGALDAMLEKIADFYDSEVETAVEALTSIIEPLMMVFVGAAVGFIMIAMYLPIFNMASAMK